MVMNAWFRWLMIGSAPIMLGAAFWVYLSSRKSHLREKVNSHFSQVLPRAATISGLAPGKQATFWHRVQVRGSIYAGFELKGRHFIAIPALFSLFAVAGWLWLGWLGAAFLFAAAVLVIGILIPYTRWRRRQDLITSQVPMFIDQILRSLGTGRSMEGAVRLAAQETPSPLSHMLNRVIRAIDLGADLSETLSEAARLHGLRELSLSALAIRISNTYGSSPREMLQSVVQIIRQRELAQRELSALTGETKVSAWVLGIMPIALASYMVAANPGYLENMLNDPSGKTLLIAAVGLQAAGALILWRMLKSV